MSLFGCQFLNIWERQVRLESKMTASPPTYSLVLFSWLLFCSALVPSSVCPLPYCLAPFSWLTFQPPLMFTLSRENCLKEPRLFCFVLKLTRSRRHRLQKAKLLDMINGGRFVFYYDKPISFPHQKLVGQSFEVYQIVLILLQWPRLTFQNSSIPVSLKIRDNFINFLSYNCLNVGREWGYFKWLYSLLEPHRPCFSTLMSAQEFYESLF